MGSAGPLGTRDGAARLADLEGDSGGDSVAKQAMWRAPTRANTKPTACLGLAMSDVVLLGPERPVTELLVGGSFAAQAKPRRLARARHERAARMDGLVIADRLTLASGVSPTCLHGRRSSHATSEKDGRLAAVSSESVDDGDRALLRNVIDLGMVRSEDPAHHVQNMRADGKQERPQGRAVTRYGRPGHPGQRVGWLGSVAAHQA
jgi:hypothetical protein